MANHMLSLFGIEDHCSVVAVGFGLLHDLLCDKDFPLAVRNIE